MKLVADRDCRNVAADSGDLLTVKLARVSHTNRVPTDVPNIVWR